MEHKLINGGGQYLPFARSRIKALRATGLQYATQRFSIDGAEVCVRISGEHDHIQISEEDVKILSGVVKGGTVSGDPAVLTSYKPTQNAWDVPLKKNTAKPVTSFNDEEFLASAGTQYADLSPTMYSGLMTKAVQIIMGRGMTVAYDYKWAKCHGIAIAVDGAPWLIEISNTNGVLAMPFPKDRPFKSSRNNAVKQISILLKGVPNNKTFPTGADLTAKIASGDILRLLTTTELAPFYGKTAFSSAMGWSFNNTGSEAHNTCHYVPSGTLRNACHYRINITVGAPISPRAVNGPIATASATLTLMEQGRLVKRSATALGLGAENDPLAFYEPLAGSGVAAAPRETVAGSAVTVTESAPVFVCHINNVLEVARLVTPVYADITSGVTCSAASANFPTYTKLLFPAAYHKSYITTTSYPTVDRGTRFVENTFAYSVVASGIVYIDRSGGVCQVNRVYSVANGTSNHVTGEPTSLLWPKGTRDCYVFYDGQKTVETTTGELEQYNLTCINTLVWTSATVDSLGNSHVPSSGWVFAKNSTDAGNGSSIGGRYGEVNGCTANAISGTFGAQGWLTDTAYEAAKTALITSDVTQPAAGGVSATTVSTPATIRIVSAYTGAVAMTSLTQPDNLNFWNNPSGTGIDFEVRSSAFGTVDHAAYTPGVLASSVGKVTLRGAMLASETSPSTSKFTFVGYI